MTLLTTIASFLLAIGILVTFHELGHYWVARWCDVKILRFSIGFGKPLWLRRYGPDQTEWVLAALPLGGYVRMADERDGSVEATASSAEKKRAFNNKTVWQRMLIVMAGPLANFILAAFFYWVLFVVGTPGIKPYVAVPVEATAAARAGFSEFDLITKVATRPVSTWGDARIALLEAAVERGSVEIEVEQANGQRAVKRLLMDSLVKEDLDKDFLAKLGLNAYRLKPLPVVEEVVAASAAARADLMAGDRISMIQGKPIARWDELVEVVSKNPGNALAFEIERNGRQLEKTITPDSFGDKGKTVGRIGIRPAVDQQLLSKLNITVRYGPVESIGHAWAEVWQKSIFSLKMMGRMLLGDISWKNLSGPITIADYAGQSAQMGWMQYLTFLALISVSLGVLNLLPIPVLDGGQLMYYMAEVFKGSPVSERTMEIGQQIGLTLLLGMTAFAFYNDIHRLVAG